jgi:hypothetical protein
MPTRTKSRKTGAGRALQPVRQTLRRLEQEGVRLVARARADAARYLTASQQRALGDLMKQARRLGVDVERRMKHRRREFETRAEKIVAEVERRAARALSSTIKRLKLATQADVRRIEERLARLESRSERADSPGAAQQTLSS